jgi:hypothetical protein
MKIGIIGPNTLKNASKKELEERKILLVKAAEILSESKKDIVLTPDKNSLLEFFGKKYLELGGKKIWIIAPMKDDAEKYLNLEFGEIIDCEMWYRQPSKFSEETDLLICLGYSAGVLSEIGASQYFNQKKILVINEFVTSKLPAEINQSIDIEYLYLKKLSDYL